MIKNLANSAICQVPALWLKVIKWLCSKLSSQMFSIQVNISKCQNITDHIIILFSLFSPYLISFLQYNFKFRFIWNFLVCVRKFYTCYLPTSQWTKILDQKSKSIFQTSYLIIYYFYNKQNLCLIQFDFLYIVVTQLGTCYVATQTNESESVGCFKGKQMTYLLKISFF